MYKIGYRYELKVVKKLRESGWDAWRTPASKSPIDVVAIRPDPFTKRLLIKLIQVKSTSKDEFDIKNLTLAERLKLKELVNKYKDFDNVFIELWVFFRKKKKVKIYDLKSYFLNKQ